LESFQPCDKQEKEKLTEGIMPNAFTIRPKRLCQFSAHILPHSHMKQQGDKNKIFTLQGHAIFFDK
jgi:hypothetical protein